MSCSICMYYGWTIKLHLQKGAFGWADHFDIGKRWRWGYKYREGKVWVRPWGYWMKLKFRNPNPRKQYRVR